jgi:tetratricopeptide (TPR) repeat protein
MFRALLAIVLTVQSVAHAAPQDDVTATLARAEALYYEARFNDSIQLLARVDGLLATRPGNVAERINTKLQMALAYIGLNQNAKAKTSLMELFALDPDFAADPQQFPPKVLALVAEAKTEQKKARCHSAVGEARKQLEAGNGAALRDLIGHSKPGCRELEAFEPLAADLLYKGGVASYKSGAFLAAVGSFEAVLKLAPRHELASEYMELANSKLQMADERLVLQWQKDFEAHQYSQAAAEFRQIASSNGGSVPALVDRMKTEYRKALTTLVENWNRTCPVGDSASMDAIRSQVSELLPEPSFASDLQDQMMPCPNPGEVRRAELAAAIAETPRPTAPAESMKPVSATSPAASGNAASSGSTAAITPAPPSINIAAAAVVDKTPTPEPVIPAPAPILNAVCLQTPSQLALMRLKTRVDPEVPPSLRAIAKVAPDPTMSFRVKARIDEMGNVTAADAQGGSAAFNAVVGTAVQGWKFTPVRDQNGPRCVETEIPIAWKVR